MIKKLVLALATLPLALAGSLTPAATATADPAPVTVIYGQGLDDCPYGAVCLYQHPQFNERFAGYIWIVTGNSPNLNAQDPSGEYTKSGDDQAESVYANVSTEEYKVFVDLYSKPDYGPGTYMQILPWEQREYPTLRHYEFGVLDKDISSVKFHYR